MENAIEKRRAVRKYRNKALSEEMLFQIEEKIKKISPMNEKLEYKIELLTAREFQTDFKSFIDAPYYLLLSSEKADGYLENIGYMGEQIVLSLADIGLATCWIGSIRVDKNAKFSIPPVIAVAVGEEDKKASKVKPRKRKEFNAVVAGDKPTKLQRQILKAAILAPSSMNMQPIYYIIDDNVIHIFRKKYLINLSLITKMQKIDTGIALAHLTIKTALLGLRFKSSDLSAQAQRISDDYYITSLVFNKK